MPAHQPTMRDDDDDRLQRCPSPGTSDPLVLREIARQLEGLRFGTLEIVVHDGTVTQIERREKLRLRTRTPPG